MDSLPGLLPKEWTLLVLVRQQLLHHFVTCFSSSCASVIFLADVEMNRFEFCWLLIEVLCAKDIYDQLKEQSRKILGDDFVISLWKMHIKIFTWTKTISSTPHTSESWGDGEHCNSLFFLLKQKPKWNIPIPYDKCWMNSKFVKSLSPFPVIWEFPISVYFYINTDLHIQEENGTQHLKVILASDIPRGEFVLSRELVLDKGDRFIE